MDTTQLKPHDKLRLIRTMGSRLPEGSTVTVTEINGNLVSFENDVGAGVVSMDELDSIFELAPEEDIEQKITRRVSALLDESDVKFNSYFENRCGVMAARLPSGKILSAIVEVDPEDALDEDDLYELCVDQIECQLYDLEEYVVISKGDSPTDECADCCGDDCDECPFAYDDEEDMI